MATSFLLSSEETSYCDACRIIKKVTSVAVYSCEECRHELCTTCVEHHRNTLSTRNHKVTQLKHIKESEFEVTQGVQGMSISSGPSTKSIANTPGKVYTTATLKKGLKVSLESDGGLCEVWGIVLLQDRIIVSDAANSKLKVFDNSSTFQFDYNCDNKPFDIDMLDNTTIVSSLGRTTIVVSLWGCKLKVLSVGSDSMEVFVNINTEYPCYGVCCHDGNIYCVVREEVQSEWYSEVRVYSPDGTLKRKFEYLSDGKVVCNHLEYITVNPRTGTLYVTDWVKGVVAMSTSGDVIAVMSPPQLKNPVGITVDDHGQIYVCGMGSHNVIQMSADGNHVVEILSKNPRCKWAQSVKIYGNRMFVSRRESGTVYIYELS